MPSRFDFVPVLLTCCVLVQCSQDQGGCTKYPPALPQKPTVDYKAVKADITKLMKTPRDFWPIDVDTYGPLFIRLAWHCAGSYRESDGRGGCDGGRIRFNPERSWDDNTNLDKAVLLLHPIKLKYGPGLSWGDLIVLTGDAAIESMGGPIIGFCGGRKDDPDGSESLIMGPTKEQNEVTPCEVNGNCEYPFGTTTIGLIYVNPEGPLGVPDPKGSAPQIRSAFGRMGMNDRETVALIGGGHAFGKTHGACPSGPGPSPIQDPTNPWPGTCGSGKGKDTFTSGFEGVWTSRPTAWTNEFFSNLLNLNWTKFTGPGGKNQWQTVPDDGKLRMLTSDIALLLDPSYKALVTEYAGNITSLNHDFSHAWYKLMTRDMGPIVRCQGDLVPPVAPFQDPLPPPPEMLPDFAQVRTGVAGIIHVKNEIIAPDMTVEGAPYYGALFVNLAYQCSSTYRRTDHKGGCNGARIRFQTQTMWPHNTGMDKVIAVLSSLPVFQKPGCGNLSIADLIVLAGQVALEDAGAQKVEFAGGRVDALDGGNLDFLAPRTYYLNPIHEAKDTMAIMGLSAHDYVALAGRPRSPSQEIRLGRKGTFSEDSYKFSNQFFIALLEEHWEPTSAKKTEYKAVGKDLYMQPIDMALFWDPAFKAIVEHYASDLEYFKVNFKKAWTYLMNAELYGREGSSFGLQEKKAT